MFERFTDRGRTTVMRAQEGAIGLGHGYIGTEHLLLGLLAEGTVDGVAGVVLTRLGIDTTVVRDAIVALVGESSSTISDSDALASLGIDLEEVKRRLEASFGPNALPSPDRPPFTPRARDALMRAVTESEAMYHGYVGTEHILLGLIADEGGLAHAILQARGVDFGALRTSILELAAGDFLRMKAADAKLDRLTMLAVPDHYDVFADVGTARLKEIEARTSAMKVFLDEYEAAIAKAEAELAARGLTLKA